MGIRKGEPMLSVLSIHVKGLAARVSRSDEGATMVEYGIMIAAIAAVVITIAFALGLEVNKAFETVDSCVVAKGVGC
jgi:pilus assembly protein Flp/PilA